VRELERELDKVARRTARDCLAFVADHYSDLSLISQFVEFVKERFGVEVK
jgi:hypothetical protein